MQNLTYQKCLLGDFLGHWTRVARCRKPVIAAVNGFAVSLEIWLEQALHHTFCSSLPHIFSFTEGRLVSLLVHYNCKIHFSLQLFLIALI